MIERGFAVLVASEVLCVDLLNLVSTVDGYQSEQ